ncbi:MAG: CRISPR-associated helicase Cas3', partial [bacterium]
KTLLRINCRIHIGTATMPSVLYNELLEILGGYNEVYEVKLPDSILNDFNRHEVYKEKDESCIIPILKKAISNNEKILVIYNTVGQAQEAFKSIKEEFSDIPKMLIHSRFRRVDRVALEAQLKSDFNGDGSEQTDNGFSPCIVVSTQVVEVSLDISFDRMITQCAPLDSLIQRFGRINRKRTLQTIKKFKPVHVIAPNDNVLPYKRDILEKSFDQLPNEGNILKECELQSKIDNVYSSLDLKKIDGYFIYKKGQYTLKELTHTRKAVLIEALEIEGATCILEDDREDYLKASWEERVQLEIPINWKTIARHRNKYEQLNVGSNPFVIPQSFEDCQLYGLQLVEPENIL